MSSGKPERPDRDPLARQLGELLHRVDPVPADVVEAAQNGFGWRALDAELARLTRDSDLAGAGVRGEPPRLLAYQAGDRSIEIEVSDVAGRLRVLGQLVPPQPALIRADQPAGAVTASADPLGRFAFRDLPPGPTRFSYRPLGPDGQPEGTEVLSEWLVL